MRIYAVADLHGKPQSLERVDSFIKETQPDILIIAGDATHFFNYKPTIEWMDKVSAKVLAITGNTDLKQARHQIKDKNMLMDNTPFTKDGITFIGVSGTIPLPFLSRIGFNETSRLAPLEAKITPKTILVAHPPPRGTCDRVMNRFHAGSSNLKAFVKKHQPMMVLCGHIHEQAGFEYINHTLVVNCAVTPSSSGALIDILSDQPLKVKMLGPH
ncbi:MAG: phosphoesterase [Desulfobacteraceae bacterium]|nr:phosphoesterase [Desulfobacteraceae bacterium]